MTDPAQSNESPASACMRMTTAEATVAALVAHDIDTIYALPGVHNDSLFDALFRAGDRVRTIHTRHEQGAAYMALGAALATAKPQAYAVVPGPGLLNSAAALLTAYGMNAPVLALIGQIAQSAIGRELGHLHEIRDQRQDVCIFAARIGKQAVDRRLELFANVVLKALRFRMRLFPPIAKAVREIEFQQPVMPDHFERDLFAGFG